MTTYPLRTVVRKQESADAVSLFLDVPVDLRPAFAYRAGQFIAVAADLQGGPTTRQYSLSSAPGQDAQLRITIKKVPEGVMSTWLVDVVNVGDLLEVAPPRGRFFLPLTEPHHVVLLAAGSGIAPLFSIARHVLSENVGHRVTIAYGNRSCDSIILADELNELVKNFADRCTLEHVLSRAEASWSGRRGHVDPAYLAERFDTWHALSPLPMAVYICGPDSFMNSTEQFFVDRGLALEKIRKESFDLVLNDDGGEPDLLVTASNATEEAVASARIFAVVSGEEVEVESEAGEPILAALLRSGADVPFSCQEGTCSSCITKLKEGAVHIRPGALKTLRQADLDEGLILACLSRPASPVVRVDFEDL
jgi:ferredoxin-NADP reductase